MVFPKNLQEQLVRLTTEELLEVERRLGGEDEMSNFLRAAVDVAEGVLQSSSDRGMIATSLRPYFEARLTQVEGWHAIAHALATALKEVHREMVLRRIANALLVSEV